MRLEEYRKNKGLTYHKLAEYLGVTTGIVFRACKFQGCISLFSAHKIVQGTKGEVDYIDLLDTREVC